MPLSPPPSFGSYAVLETLEAHAFTVTYRAEHRRLGRAVRIKALKPTVSVDSPFAADLEREAAVLGRLDHDGIIRLHDIERAPDALYLVLEDARGVALDEVLRAGPIAVDQALAIGLAIARALGHAHERGVVLRALSAASVVITPRGRVLLADLSAAVGAAGDADDHAPRTESPTPPSYLAPEQILGDPATPRSDVWSLGILVHEMLAGARPFDADDPRLLATRIRTDAPAPLPLVISPAITRIVTRCLAKDPADRYPDATAVAAALDDALAAVSRLPLPVLATRALAAARLGDALPPPSGAISPAPLALPAGPDVQRAARSLVIVLALILSGGISIRLLAAGDEGAPGDGVAEATPPVSGSRDRGHLRVVARPWAEVYVDGQLVDTTPIGRPIAVTPGKHFVTFRHPQAADEQRTVKVAVGQTVFLDVSMRIDRGDAGAPRDAGPPPGASP
ncbi:MAG: serine/threonine-protein kinase [Minicystis sp.]